MDAETTTATVMMKWVSSVITVKKTSLTLTNVNNSNVLKHIASTALLFGSYTACTYDMRCTVHNPMMHRPVTMSLQ